MKYAYASVLIYSQKSEIEIFYHAAANSSADIIYLGGNVLTKRR
ncbi:putative protease [Yersinia pseudotuberculosis]|nr:putative protease [Yersinia pseudotuberculosis]